MSIGPTRSCKSRCASSTAARWRLTGRATGSSGTPPPSNSIACADAGGSIAKQLQGNIAIVTGASNGIGRGIAETFAAEGAKTVIVARRAALLDEVAAGIKRNGGEALAIAADLTREAEIAALFATVHKNFSRLDVLINNAGIAAHRDTEDNDLAYWQAALDINI